jgi:hypothetical protein
MADLAGDLDAYAAFALALADPNGDRGALLAARGLTEEAWEAIDDAWQARLSGAEADAANASGVPAFAAAFAEAFARAQRARARTEVSFDRFVEATRAMQRGTEMATVLKRLDLTLDDFLAEQARWTAAMLIDDALAERFRRALRGPR